MIWFSATGTAPIKPKVYNEGFDFFYDSWSELHIYTQHMAYSTMSYKHGKRLKKNVEGYGSLLIYDIDNGYTGQALHEATKGFKKLIVTTMSHTKDKPRMRLLLPLTECLPMVDEDLYKQIMLTVAKGIGLDAELIDKSCLSTDRQYAPNPTQQHFYFDGETLVTSEIVAYAENDLQANKPVVKAIRPVFNNNSSMMPLQDMRQYIKDNHSFDLMASLLESKGLTVKRDGSVVIAGNKTQALSIDKTTGILANFAEDQFYDVVSVHVDHYKDMTLADATKHYYNLLGGN